MGLLYYTLFHFLLRSVFTLTVPCVSARQNEERTKIFNPSKKIDKYFEVDEQNKMWKTYSSSIIFTYDEIADYELIENGESFTKGSLGGAIVGGALFGGVGAIVGSSMKAKTKQEISQYMIKIITKNPFAQETIINFLTTGKVKSDSFLYKSYSNAAQSILSQLTIITNCAIAAENSVQNSSADEILKFKQLLDAGVITQEEFEAKKKQLLGL